MCSVWFFIFRQEDQPNAGGRPISTTTPPYRRRRQRFRPAREPVGEGCVSAGVTGSQCWFEEHGTLHHTLKPASAAAHTPWEPGPLPLSFRRLPYTLNHFTELPHYINPNTSLYILLMISMEHDNHSLARSAIHFQFHYGNNK